MALADHLAPLTDLARRGDRHAAAAARELTTLIARGRAVGEALVAWEDGATRRVGITYTEVLALLDALETFVATYFEDLDFPPELFLEARQAQRHLAALDVLRRAFARQTTLTAGADSDAVLVDGRPLVPYRLRQGDTLERLALRFLGDAARAWELVELNDLVYPFVDTRRDLRPGQFEEEQFTEEFFVQPSPDRRGVPAGVRVTGEVLLFPPDAQVSDPATSFTPQDAELYGRDFRLVDGVVAFAADGDFLVADGVANMEQALLQRLGTGRGELVLHPTYGVEHQLVVGVEGTRANTIVVGLEIARAIMEDPRVRDVRNLHQLFANTTHTLSMNVLLIGPGERLLPLNQVVPGLGGAQ